MDIRRIVRGGNSVYVSIPKKYLCEMGIHCGSYVVMVLKKGVCLFRKLTPEEKHLSDIDKLP